MSYSSQNVTSVRLDKTPALLFNNLSVGTDQIAYIHKNDIYSIDKACLDGRSPCATFAVPNCANHRFTQVKWCEVGGTSYLVGCMENGFQIFDSSLSKMMLHHIFPKAKDGSQPFGCGISVVPMRQEILVGSSTGKIVVAEVAADKISVERGATAHVYPVSAIVADDVTGATVVSADEYGTIVVWEPDSLEPRCTFEGNGDMCTGIAARGNVLIAAFVTGLVKIFSLHEQIVRAEIADHTRAITGLAFHPSRFTFATVSEDTVLNVWSMPDAGSSNTGFKTVLDMSTEITDHPLTGVEFVKRSGRPGSSTSGAHIVASSYDVLHLRVFLAI